MSRAMHRSLFARIEAKRDDLVALTRDLIRFPTVNPPGEAYTPCAEYLGARLKARGFEVGYHRAEGETGDSARYPRTNVVARREGGRPGPCVHFNGHIDVVAVGHGWKIGRAHVRTPVTNAHIVCRLLLENK